MYINNVDKIIELTCKKLDLNIDEEQGVQLHFEGQNELDYFLVQRIYDWGDDEDSPISVFYTEGCDTTGNWTYIEARLEPTFVQFSVDVLPIKVHLPKLTTKKYQDLRTTLELALRHLGRFIDNGSR